MSVLEISLKNESSSLFHEEFDMVILYNRMMSSETN